MEPHKGRGGGKTHLIMVGVGKEGGGTQEWSEGQKGHNKEGNIVINKRKRDGRTFLCKSFIYRVSSSLQCPSKSGSSGTLGQGSRFFFNFI